LPYTTLFRSPLAAPTNPTTTIERDFGVALALYGDTMVISEPTSNGFVAPEGKVHVYGWNGSSFSFGYTIEAPSPTFHDRFGEAVALAGDYLAISGESPAGGVRVYRRSAGVFSPIWSLAGAAASKHELAFDFEGPRL